MVDAVEARIEVPDALGSTTTDVLAGPAKDDTKDEPLPPEAPKIEKDAPASVPAADSATHKAPPLDANLHLVSHEGNVILATSSGVALVSTVTFLNVTTIGVANTVP